jgi:ParB/RepB/Spo0J family partition protein
MTDVISTGQELAFLPIDSIRPGDNDRKTFDETELWQLSESIAEIGLGMAILVRPTPSGPTPYQLVGGERRWRAHQLPPCAHLATIKAIIDHDLSDREADAMMLAENTGRVDLGIIEEARAYQKRIDAGATIDEVARQAGVAEFRVKWRIDMLTLCPEAQSAINSGVLPPGPALELRRLDSDLQVAALKAWQSNPTMGHLPFKSLCIKWAEQASAAEQVGLFALDTDQWIVEAQAVKAKTHSVPALRKMIAELVGAIEVLDGRGTCDPLIEKARSMI